MNEKGKGTTKPRAELTEEQRETLRFQERVKYHMRKNGHLQRMSWADRKRLEIEATPVTPQSETTTRFTGEVIKEEVEVAQSENGGAVMDSNDE